MNSYLGSNKSIDVQAHRQLKWSLFTDRQVSQSNDIQHNVQKSTAADTQPQAETLQDVAEMLTKHQRLATLPPQTIQGRPPRISAVHQGV